VGSHPLAGDHRTGPEHARADLFEDRLVVVTPSEETRPAAVTEVCGFWQNLGAEVTTMTPSKHDEALAITSHLPHLVAVALANATPTEMLRLTASGWRDMTRIAAAEPALWQPIFASNRDHILDSLDLLTETLGNLRETLEEGDYETLTTMLQAAVNKKRERDALGD
jgi:prephenate dehydrogenase